MSGQPTTTRAGSPASGSPALSLRGLRVRRGNREVLAVDTLEVTRGETLAVLGRNGAGKSTLLLAAALLIPADGAIAYGGEVARRRLAVAFRRQTSTVFQQAALLDMSARRNVEEALAIHGVPRAARAARAMSWLERLGVAGRSEARPHQLSGGEAQRVSIARALAVQPAILFLDEPFSGLDTETRGRLVGEMQGLLRETGVTALLSTHDHAEAAVLADRLLVLDEGQVIASGPTAVLLAHPPSPQVASLLDFALVDTAAHEALGLHSAGALAGVPPAAVRVSLPVPSPEPDARRGRIVAVEAVAGGVRLRLEVAGVRLAAEMSVADYQEAGWSVGADADVQIAKDRVTWW